MQNFYGHHITLKNVKKRTVEFSILKNYAVPLYLCNTVMLCISNVQLTYINRCVDCGKLHKPSLLKIRLSTFIHRKKSMHSISYSIFEYLPMLRKFFSHFYSLFE